MDHIKKDKNNHAKMLEILSNFKIINKEVVI